MNLSIKSRRSISGRGPRPGAAGRVALGRERAWRIRQEVRWYGFLNSSIMSSAVVITPSKLLGLPIAGFRIHPTSIRLHGELISERRNRRSKEIATTRRDHPLLRQVDADDLPAAPTEDYFAGARHRSLFGILSDDRVVPGGVAGRVLLVCPIRHQKLELVLARGLGTAERQPAILPIVTTVAWIRVRAAVRNAAPEHKSRQGISRPALLRRVVSSVHLADMGGQWTNGTGRVCRRRIERVRIGGRGSSEP